MARLSILSLVLVVGIFASSTPCGACGICEAVAPTICDNVGVADIAVFGRLAKRATGFGGLSEFRIDHVIKGRDKLGDVRVAVVRYFPLETQADDTPFLIIGNALPEVRWTTPIEVTARSKQYILKMFEFPKEGVERLVYSLPYIRDQEELLWRDAYDEFAKAPYDVIEQLKPHLNSADLKSWIDSNTDQFSKLTNLYFTLLSVCGREEDLPFLEAKLRAPNVTKRNDLNALIACYLSIAKENGIPLIEELFLSSGKYDALPAGGMAIAALRFHGQEAKAIDRAHIEAAMIRLLDIPIQGRAVLSDLARWQVWAPLDKVGAMFTKAAEYENPSWIRDPAIRYVVACPLPKANALLAGFERAAPKLVERVRQELERQQKADEAKDKPPQTQIADEPKGDPQQKQVAKADSDPQDQPDHATSDSTGNKTIAPSDDGQSDQTESAGLPPVAWLLVPVAVLAVVVVILVIGLRRNHLENTKSA
jgi:hypothetical protein